MCQQALTYMEYTMLVQSIFQQHIAFVWLLLATVYSAMLTTGALSAVQVEMSLKS